MLEAFNSLTEDEPTIIIPSNINKCRCGSDTHSRTNYSLCPLKKKPFRIALARRDSYNNCIEEAWFSITAISTSFMSFSTDNYFSLSLLQF